MVLEIISHLTFDVTALMGLARMRCTYWSQMVEFVFAPADCVSFIPASMKQDGRPEISYKEYQAS